MRKRVGLVTALAAIALSGCATTSASGPVEVTRFHLGAPLETGTIIVEPLPGGGPPSLEFQTYAAAVRSEALKSGFTAPAGTEAAAYLAVVGFTRATRPGPPRRSGISVGLGGGGYSGGVGLGGSVSFPIGKQRSREVILTDLSVQIRRRADGAVIWEGRAQTAAALSPPDADAAASAAKLSRALFRGFPGESGRTITVR